MAYQKHLRLVCRLDNIRKQTGSDIDVAIDPEELEGLDDSAVRQLYEQRLAEEQAKRSREVPPPPLDNHQKNIRQQPLASQEGNSFSTY